MAYPTGESKGPYLGVRYFEGQPLPTAPSEMIVWDGRTGQKLLRFHPPPGRSLALSRDGRLLAAGGFDDQVRVWEATTGRELISLTGRRGPIMGMCFSSDGSRLAAAGRGGVSIWDTATGARHLTLTASGRLTWVTFSPDGHRLATSGMEGIVQLWDAATGHEVFTLPNLAPWRPENYEFQARVVFRPDGKQIAANNWDASISLWDTDGARDAPTELTIDDFAEIAASSATALKTDSDNEFLLRHCVRLCWLAGDEEGYVNHRRALLALYGNIKDPMPAVHAIESCYLPPHPGDDPKQATALADLALNAAIPSWPTPYLLFFKGLVEYRQGRLDSAIEWLHKALPPPQPPGVWSRPLPELVLAMAYHARGQTDEAQRWFREARWGESRKPLADFNFELDFQILKREAEALIELGPRLAAARKGKVQLSGPAEQLALAQRCVDCQRFTLDAARLFAEALTADPGLAEDRTPRYRYHAACCAARVGTGRGKDAEKLAEPERARWRRQALSWLRAELIQWIEPVKQSPLPDRAALRRTLERWQHDPALAGLRDPAALTQLPAGEQQAYKQLWEEVGAALRIAQEQPPKLTER
jgi:tetratricopeptide (TPR) repeat protein